MSELPDIWVVGACKSYEPANRDAHNNTDRVRQPERTATSLLTHWINAFPSLPGSDTVGRQPLGKRYIDLTRQRPAHHLAFGGLSLRLSLILTIETLGLENKWVRTGLQDTGRIRVMATALNTNCDTTGNECRLDAALLRLTLVAFRLQEAAGEPHPSLRPSTPCPRATSFPICRNRYLSEVPTPLRLTDEAGLPELAWVRWVKELSRSEANLNEASVWEGYYLYRNVPTRVARMDQPMRDVELLFDKGESRYVGITGKGADQHGPFTLVGTMNWESLRFSILKQYIGAHAFRWYGVLTPFGMVGTWHQPRAQDPNDEVGDDDPDPSDDPYRSSLGSFWLWRRHTEANPCPTYD